MSEDAGQSIHDRILADLTAGQTAEAEPVAVEAAPQVESDTPTTPAAAPVAPAEVPRSFKAKVAGEEIEVPLYGEDGSINPELVAMAQKAQDYTRKMQAVAQERRAVEAEKIAWQAEQLKAKEQQLPELPEDDPYAQRLAAYQKRMELLEQQNAGVQSFLDAQTSARDLEASRVALVAEEKRIALEHGLTQQQVEAVEFEFYRRDKAGEEVSLDMIAKAHRAAIDSLKAEAVKEWKEKNRVGAPAGGVSTPATGTAPAVLTPHSPGFLDRIMQELGAT